MVHAVEQLHHDHGLSLDTEVDHAVKAHATYNDVTEATALRCFPTDEDGRITVPPVTVEPSFLNSEPFRLRLLLNALTSPHAFLGGNIARYYQHRRHAEHATALLAIELHDDNTITLADAIAAVSQHPDGPRGKDFLGYTPTPHLYAILNRGLARLAADSIVEDIDGNRFRCDPTPVTAAIKQLQATDSRARADRHTWDNDY